MHEYIDKQAFLDHMKGTSRYFDVKFDIENFPNADVAPVVHGRWVWHEEEFEYECSACHCRFDYNRTFELFDHGFQYADYCPHCGAEMDGGDNDAAN